MASSASSSSIPSSASSVYPTAQTSQIVIPATITDDYVVEFYENLQKLNNYTDIQIVSKLNGKNCQDIYIIVYSLIHKYNRDIVAQCSNIDLDEGSIVYSWELVSSIQSDPIGQMLNNKIDSDIFTKFCNFTMIFKRPTRYSCNVSSPEQSLDQSFKVFASKIPKQIRSIDISNTGSLFLSQSLLDLLARTNPYIESLTIRTESFMNVKAFRNLKALHETSFKASTYPHGVVFPLGLKILDLDCIPYAAVPSLFTTNLTNLSIGTDADDDMIKQYYIIAKTRMNPRAVVSIHSSRFNQVRTISEKISNPYASSSGSIQQEVVINGVKYIQEL